MKTREVEPLPESYSASQKDVSVGAVTLPSCTKLNQKTGSPLTLTGPLKVTVKRISSPAP